MDFKQPGTIQITTFPGLVDCLESEVASLGFQVRDRHKTGLSTWGSLDDCMRLNLYLRTALNVLWQLAAFEAETSDDLYRAVYAQPWEDILTPAEYVSVVSRVDTPAIDNTMFASQRTKDAVVDRIASRQGKRPDAGRERHGAVLTLHWHGRRAWLMINTSGAKLSDRGYRRMPHKAPLREVLAAGIILTTGYDGQRPLVLPMCGSGTLAVEAAFIARRRAPGLLRDNYGFMHLKGFERKRWKVLRSEAREKAVKDIPAPIVATDIDAAAIAAAMHNARTAGVDRSIDFSVSDFADTCVPPGEGILIVNPQYGRRLGEIRRLEKTYARLGDFFKQKCAGYTAYLLTGNLDLAGKVGLRASRRIPFWNARIECRLLKYDIYAGSRRRPGRDR